MMLKQDRKPRAGMVVLTAVLLLLSLLTTSTFAQDVGVMRKIQLYKAGDGGYYTYRIASMVATRQGTLLTFCAAQEQRW